MTHRQTMERSVAYKARAQMDKFVMRMYAYNRTQLTVSFVCSAAVGGTLSFQQCHCPTGQQLIITVRSAR